MAGQRLIPEARLLSIRTRIPSRDLDDRALVARLKNAKGPGTTYEDFLVARQGKGSISRDTFLLYMEEVTPDPGIMEELVRFSPTHRDRSGLYRKRPSTAQGRWRHGNMLSKGVSQLFYSTLIIDFGTIPNIERGPKKSPLG